MFSMFSMFFSMFCKKLIPIKGELYYFFHSYLPFYHRAVLRITLLINFFKKKKCYQKKRCIKF
ncbi:hypothetical protein GLOIN_2v1886809, partial [Rhizophagus irregularis DAOM 181602=DAOM 197198]